MAQKRKPPMEQASGYMPPQQASSFDHNGSSSSNNNKSGTLQLPLANMNYLIQQINDQQQLSRPRIKKAKMTEVTTTITTTGRPPNEVVIDDNDEESGRGIAMTASVPESAGGEDEIELGEVVSIEKLKNTSLVAVIDDTTMVVSNNSSSLPYSNNIVRLSSQPPPPSLPATTTTTTSQANDVAVSIPRKMMPIVSNRIIDWLEKSVELTSTKTTTSSLSSDLLLELLGKAWPKMLLVYMIENCFAFYVTRDVSSQQQQRPSSNSNDGTPSPPQQSSPPPPSLDEARLPKEKDAHSLMNMISHGNQFGLNSLEYDLLKEVVLFREGKLTDLRFACFNQLNHFSIFQKALKIHV